MTLRLAGTIWNWKKSMSSSHVLFAEAQPILVVSRNGRAGPDAAQLLAAAAAQALCEAPARKLDAAKNKRAAPHQLREPGLGPEYVPRLRRLQPEPQALHRELRAAAVALGNGRRKRS
jgi:hypothetical protein